MSMNIDMILDLQFGSTGKGLIAGYLAKRNDYDTAICAFAPNAGHTYIDKSRGIHAITQQLPTAAISGPSVRNILLGPGSLIHIETLENEIHKYENHLEGKRILIHPYAAVVTDRHAQFEKERGASKIGSTTKGVGEAQIQRIRRDPLDLNIAMIRLQDTDLKYFLCTADEYRQALDEARNVIIEGAQGFSLSIYHGMYPYVTSRDVTPWQVAADCGLPFRWASSIKVIGTMRTLPIRVNNRDGTSGPCYEDQREIHWSEIGIEPEKTTVTKLDRRLFTFSQAQARLALWHCAHYWETRIFLNFANYMNPEELVRVMNTIEFASRPAPKITWLGFGPDDADIITQGEQRVGSDFNFQWEKA